MLDCTHYLGETHTNNLRCVPHEWTNHYSCADWWDCHKPEFDQYPGEVIFSRPNPITSNEEFECPSIKNLVTWVQPNKRSSRRRGHESATNPRPWSVTLRHQDMSNTSKLILECLANATSVLSPACRTLLSEISHKELPEAVMNAATASSLQPPPAGNI